MKAKTRNGARARRMKHTGPAISRTSQSNSTPNAENGFNGRRTLSERLYLALKHDIIRGIHPPGEALGEKALAKRYKSSRTPVREAAVRLQHENLLRIVPNRGYFASSMTIGWINEIYEFRAAIEGACAELAARKGGDEALLQELEQLGHSDYETNDRDAYEKFIRDDTAFHMGLARLTRNNMLVRAVADMRSHMERIMYAAIGIGYYGEAPTKEHVNILNAVRQRDCDLARRLMHEHILQSRVKVLRLGADNLS